LVPGTRPAPSAPAHEPGFTARLPSPPPAFSAQLQEHQPFISELLGGLSETIQDLQPHQIHSFYESVRACLPA
jgi:hypothetical protein